MEGIRKNGDFRINKAYISNAMEGPCDGDGHRFIYQDGVFIVQSRFFDHRQKVSYWRNITLEMVDDSYDGLVEYITRSFNRFKKEVTEKLENEFWEKF